MAIRKVLECRDLDKLIKKLEPHKVGDIVSVQNQIGNYNVSLHSFEEINVIRISILKRSCYDGQSAPKMDKMAYINNLVYIFILLQMKVIGFNVQ